MTTDLERERRLERERKWHHGHAPDLRVGLAPADDARAPVDRFYVISGALNTWYRASLSAHAVGARALEYGCGFGSRAFHLAREGAHVVGIDISPVSIEHATARGQDKGLGDRVRFSVMDAENLEFPDGSFDLVCGSGILHHLDLNRAYAEIARVLDPSGIAVFEEPLGHNPAINAYRKRTPAFRTVDEHPLRTGDLALAEHFFGEVETRFFSLSSLVAIPLRNLPGFQRIVDGLDGLDRWLFRVVPLSRRYAWTVGMTLRLPRSAAAGADQ